MVNLDVVGDGDSVERVWNGQDARVFPKEKSQLHKIPAFTFPNHLTHSKNISSVFC